MKLEKTNKKDIEEKNIQKRSKLELQYTKVTSVNLLTGIFQ